LKNIKELDKSNWNEFNKFWGSLKTWYVFITNYKIVGSGAYSSVYKVKRLADGLEYAMKKVDINDLTTKEK